MTGLVGPVGHALSKLRGAEGSDRIVALKAARELRKAEPELSTPEAQAVLYQKMEHEAAGAPEVGKDLRSRQKVNRFRVKGWLQRTSIKTEKSMLVVPASCTSKFPNGFHIPREATQSRPGLLLQKENS